MLIFYKVSVTANRYFWRLFVFLENRAAASKEIFNEAGLPLEHGISGIIPTAIPQLIREAGLMGREFTDQAIDARRQTLLARYQEKLKVSFPESFGLRDQLLSTDMSRRVLAYSQLAGVQRNSQGKLPEAVSDYLRASAFLEPRIVRQEVLDLMKGQAGLKSSLVQSSEIKTADYGVDQWSKKMTVSHSRVEAIPGGAGYRISHRLILDMMSKRMISSRQIWTLETPLLELSKNERVELLWDGVVVDLEDLLFS